MRRKKSERTKLKGVLWKEFSLFIKLRDNYTCITCGREGAEKGMHCGHFIPAKVCGKNDELYYHEHNNHAQCFHCNKNLGGYGAKYYENMKIFYCQEEIDELWKLKRSTAKKNTWTEDQIKEKIDYYKQRNENT